MITEGREGNIVGNYSDPKLPSYLLYAHENHPKVLIRTTPKYVFFLVRATQSLNSKRSAAPGLRG